MENVLLTVLNMSVTGGLIIAAVTLIRFFLQKLPRRYSYYLWAIPAFRLLCPISISSVVSFFNLLKPRAVEQNRMEYFTPPATEYVAPTLPADPVAPTLPPMYHDSMEQVVQQAHKSLSLGEIAGIIWAAVAVGIVLWAVISYILIGRKVRRSEKADGYYICPNIPSPFVFGIIHPRIYLPTGLSEEDAECILIHEKTHISRRDYLVKLLTVPVLALHWFNPLVWLGIRLMTADMELSCDQRALTAFPRDKKGYANALLNVSMKQSGISLNGVLGFGESNVKSRIKGVLKMKKPKLWASAAAIVVVAVAGVCLLTNAIGNSKDGALPKSFDGYINYEQADIPELHFDETAETAELLDGAAPKILFAKAEAGSAEAYLLGENVYREPGDPGTVYAVDLFVGVSADGRTVSSRCSAPAELVGAPQAHYKINAESAAEYLKAFDMELPIIELNYIGGDSDIGAFYAIKDGELKLLTGDLSDVGGETSGVCFSYAALGQGAEPNTLIFNALDSYGVEYAFNFDNIRSDEYIGPHFTAKRVGAAQSGNAEFEDIIERFLTYERIFRVDSLTFGSINGPDDREIGPDDGITVNGDLYYPVTEEGFTEWRQLEDFMRGLFTDELAESYLSEDHYIEHDGKTFSLMAGGMGWYASPDYIYGSEELEDGRIRLDFYREWDSKEVGEYYVVKLILENTPDGYRISEVSQDSITDYDSYDWLAPVNRFVQKEFYFNPDFTGRHDAEDAGESIMSEIPHTVTVTFKYTNDGEFIDAFTDGRGEEVDEICALDENRLLVYDWDLIARDQIYLLNFETGETEPVLPDTAFGFSFNDYYDITGKWETIEWVYGPRLSPDGRSILYCSNKYFDGDAPAYEYSLWIYDIQSGTERRIPVLDGTDESAFSHYKWSSDGKIIFGNDGDSYVFDPSAGADGEYVTVSSDSGGVPEFDPSATEEALSLSLWDDYKEASLFLHLQRGGGELVEFDGGEYIPLAEEYDTLEKCKTMLQRAFTSDFCSLILRNQFGRHRVFVEHEGRMYAIAADYAGKFVCDLPIKGAVYDGENRMTVYTTITYDHDGDNTDVYIFRLEKEGGSWKIASIEIPDYSDGSVYYEFTQNYYYPDIDDETVNRLVEEYIIENTELPLHSYTAEYTPITDGPDDVERGTIEIEYASGMPYIRLSVEHLETGWKTVSADEYAGRDEYLSRRNGFVQDLSSANSEDLISKLDDKTGGEPVRAYVQNDFDGDGTLEAFCATGGDLDVLTLWFITENGAEEVLSDSYVLYEGNNLLDFGTDKFYTVELSFGTVSFSAIYGVRDGEWYEHEFSGKVSEISNSGNFLTGVEAGYDAFYDENGSDAGGHTYNTYYFIYNGGFKECGGIEISEEEFLRIDGASEILESSKDLGEIRNILYRGEVGIININYQKLDPEDGWSENKNVTVSLSGGRASKISESDGVIKPAMLPDIAVYPERFE